MAFGSLSISRLSLGGSTGGAAPAGFSVDNQSFSRGVLTAEGDAAHTFSGTGGTIASIGSLGGTNAAHWQASLAAGVVSISPSSAGDTADLSGGPYSLTLTCYDGAGQTGDSAAITLTITTEAATAHAGVGEAATAAAALIAADDGRTLKLLAGNYGTEIQTAFANDTLTSRATVQGDDDTDKAVITKLDINNCDNITFKDIEVVPIAETHGISPYNGSGASAAAQIILDGLDFTGPDAMPVTVTESQAAQAAETWDASQSPNDFQSELGLFGISAASTAPDYITIQNSTFQGVQEAISLRLGKGVLIQNISVKWNYGDFLKLNVATATNDIEYMNLYWVDISETLSPGGQVDDNRHTYEWTGANLWPNGTTDIDTSRAADDGFTLALDKDRDVDPSYIGGNGYVEVDGVTLTYGVDYTSDAATNTITLASPVDGTEEVVVRVESNRVHCDGMQVLGNASQTEDIPGLHIVGFRSFQPWSQYLHSLDTSTQWSGKPANTYARGGQVNASLFDSNQGTGYYLDGAKFEGCFCCHDGNRGMNIENSRDGLIQSCSAIQFDPLTPTVTSHISLAAGNDTYAGTNQIRFSVARAHIVDGVDKAADSSWLAANHNVTLGESAAWYEANFVCDAGTWRYPTSLADAFAMFQPKEGGALDPGRGIYIGAIAPENWPTDPWYDFVNQTYDHPADEDGWNPSGQFTDATDQTADSTITSNKVQISGASSTGVLLEVSGGRSPTVKVYESDGTTERWAHGGACVAFEDDWVELQDTSSASDGTQTNITLTAGTQTETWSITTASAGSISFIDSNDAVADTVSIPSHSSGDLIVVFGVKGTGGSLPSTLTGYTHQSSANTYVTCFTQVSDGTPTSVTITGATGMMVGIYRPTGGTIAVGDAQTSSGTSNTPTIPALTLDVTDGSSWVVVGHLHRGDNTSAANFSGVTERENVNTSSTRWGYYYDSNGGVASYSGETGTAALSDAWETVAIEVKVT